MAIRLMASVSANAFYGSSLCVRLPGSLCLFSEMPCSRSPIGYCMFVGFNKASATTMEKRRPPSPPLLTPLENTCSFVVCVTLSSALLANRRLIRLV